MKTKSALLLTMQASTPFCKRCWCPPSFRPYVLSMYAGDRRLAEAVRLQGSCGGWAVMKYTKEAKLFGKVQEG